MRSVPGDQNEAGGTSARSTVARQLWVRGVVQGVGFRPFVFNLAQDEGMVGWVRNTSAGVQIVVQGTPAAVEHFIDALPRQAPPRSHIASLEVTDVEPGDYADFGILESASDPNAYQLVSPDIALCDDCRRELLDPHDRRYGYPFINCTNCGPRFTIIESLPYDRERTTMRHFPLCPECGREYEDPRDRRFHAEPNACPVCGPRTVLLAHSSYAKGEPASAEDLAARGEEALPSGLASDLVVLARSDALQPQAAVEAAAELLRRGALLAIKGLGGFHLACDATDTSAVVELKRRKGRPHKPLAVMFANVEQLRAHCRVSEDEEQLLESPEHPIVLLEWPSPGSVSAEVAVGQHYLGAMLPYTPLHLLLLRAVGRPLVMTSGNLAEEPIVTDLKEADRLAGIPDAYLLHDRAIHARYDDSVALVRRGRPRLVRRSRGYAPFPVQLPLDLPPTLACGAELKNTFCLTRDRNAFLSQHIGDLENMETLEHYEASIRLYQSLFGVRPSVVAYDLHPEYLATKYAMALKSSGDGLSFYGVQHHHAHVVACMTENDAVLADDGSLREVIGVSLDGLGFGDDGRLWGGEVLICDAARYVRVAHLEYLPLPGGELAIRRPARTAAGWLLALLGEEGLERGRRLGLHLSDEEAGVVAQQVRQSVNTPLTSSCGRLFDCVAALTGLRSAITYEAQAAIELEMLSRAGAAPYPFSVEGDVGQALPAAAAPSAASGLWLGDRPSPAVVRLTPLLAAVLDDLQAGHTVDTVGSRLHATVAAVVTRVCHDVRAAGGPDTVALSGGVFQNRLLVELCESSLEEVGLRVLTHALVPTNDGGLSLGQAMSAGYNHLIHQGLLT